MMVARARELARWVLAGCVRCQSPPPRARRDRGAQISDRAEGESPPPRPAPDPVWARYTGQIGARRTARRRAEQG